MSLQLKLEKVRDAHEDAIECYCKIKFRNTFQLKTPLKFNGKVLAEPSHTNFTDMGSLCEATSADERDRFLTSVDDDDEQDAVFLLGSALEPNELLQIECFKKRTIRKK